MFQVIPVHKLQPMFPLQFFFKSTSQDQLYCRIDLSAGDAVVMETIEILEDVLLRPLLHFDARHFAHNTTTADDRRPHNEVGFFFSRTERFC